jgi:hypothetical protein
MMGRTVVNKPIDRRPPDMKDDRAAVEFRKKRYGDMIMPCPVCHVPMEYDGTEWTCKNDDCPKTEIVEADKAMMRKKTDSVKSSVKRFGKRGKGNAKKP